MKIPLLHSLPTNNFMYIECIENRLDSRYLCVCVCVCLCVCVCAGLHISTVFRVCGSCAFESNDESKLFEKVARYPSHFKIKWIDP